MPHSENQQSGYVATDTMLDTINPVLEEICALRDMADKLKRQKSAVEKSNNIKAMEIADLLDENRRCVLCICAKIIFDDNL